MAKSAKCGQISKDELVKLGSMMTWKFRKNAPITLLQEKMTKKGKKNKENGLHRLKRLQMCQKMDIQDLRRPRSVAWGSQMHGTDAALCQSYRTETDEMPQSACFFMNKTSALHTIAPLIPQTNKEGIQYKPF